MNATIGLLAYGLRPSPLTDGVPTWLLAAGGYTSMSWELQMAAAHAGCHLSAFCRNPLHPGPCKGWKHNLGFVAPGALHALEKARHEKLEAKRQEKVKALKEAGHAVPKHLLTPIVYDPAKSKFIGKQPPLVSPAEAAKNVGPTKADLEAKIAAKHAAEVPKPTEKPIYTTLSKAGLKDGDKVFLHGKGKTPGEGQLVTVRKYGSGGGGKTVGGGKALGYTFEDANGKQIMAPHEEGVTDHPIAGGVATKWHLSPAPGQSFPETPQQAVAKKIEVAQAKGDIPTPHKTTTGQILKAKHAAQGQALGKFFGSVMGVPHDPASQKKYEEMAAKKAEGEQLMPDANIKAGADKIAAKLWSIKGNEAGDLMHQGDLEQALAKDIHDGVNEGKPTPVLDAAKDASLTLGQDKPGAMQALADAVHSKLGISGHDDTPAKPKIDVKVMHEPGKGPGSPEVPGPSPSAPLATSQSFGSPNAGAAPHVQHAIDLANGFKAATDTKKLDAYQKLTPEELAALDPNTKKLMAANLAGMQNKFLKPDKKNAAGAMLAKLQHAQGGGAGEGGHSAVNTPAAGAVADLTQDKAKMGALSAATLDNLGSGNNSTSEAFQSVLENAHKNGTIGTVSQSLANDFATSALAPYDDHLPVNEIHPHLAAEMAKMIGGDINGESPLIGGIMASKHQGGSGPLVEAIKAHPALGPKALGIHEPGHSPADVAHTLSAHAAGLPAPKGGAGASFTKMHTELLNSVGQEHHHTQLAQSFATAKTANVIKKLDLGADAGSKLQAQLHAVLGENFTKDYKQALDQNNPVPGGLAGKIDSIAAEVNTEADKFIKANKWSEHGQGATSFKSALFAGKVKEALASNPGEGGSTTHVSPAAKVIPSGPGAAGAPTIATHHASDLGAVSVPDVPELPEGQTEHALGGGDGVGHLSQSVKDKVGESFHALPFGTSTSDPIESVFDNLVAVAAWHGKDAGAPLSVLQAAQLVDEAKAKKYGSVNKNLTEKALLSWLGTKDGKEYAAAYATPKADQIMYLKDPEAVKKAALEAQKKIYVANGEKVQKLAGGPGPYDPHKPASDFASFNHQQAQKSQDDYMAKSGEKWTGKQKQAITAYTGSSYVPINDYLRKPDNSDPHYKDYATQIQAGMRPLAHDQLLIRGSSYKIFPAGFNNIEGVKKLIGEEISDSGFVSTSIAGAGGEFTKAIKLHIEAPAGTMGAYVRSISSHPNENEMILAAGTKFRILSVDTSGHQPIVRLRVVS